MKKLSETQIRELRSTFDSAESAYSRYATRNASAIRMHDSKQQPDPLRSNFAIDTDRIINCRFYNHGSDKTQVFSFYHNDEITRRASHVQLVSRIARKIGRALGLNLDLIEAISIGHDIGHTPFGHAGERILSDLYFAAAQKYFNHNVHSVRALNYILHNNLTVQTLDGILCHCGEEVHEKYEPSALPSPDMFDAMLERCYTDRDYIRTLRPSTLEGCVVRLSDMIAYIGKDRQDAETLGIFADFSDTVIGKENRDIIDNVTCDVIANSMGKPYLSLDPDVYEALSLCKTENYTKLYSLPEIRAPYDNTVAPMMKKLFDRFVCDIEREDHASPIYKQYLDVKLYRENYFLRRNAHMSAQPADIAVDFIAGMTDDYFLDVFEYLFPDDPLNAQIHFVGYFD